jgi:hypothetical protein
MTESKNRRAKRADGMPTKRAGYGPVRFYLILKKLRDTDMRHRYLPPAELARALRENPGVPLPPEIHDYLCEFLEGKIKARGGRPKVSENPVRLLKRVLVPVIYERYYGWLKQRQRSVGLEGWTLIRQAEWWQGPPSERAARMIARRLHPAIDWRRVLNIVSEANRER